MKVYLAGPMTGYVNHNFEAFIAAAARLRDIFGFEVVNPAELDGDTPHEELRQIPHHVFMRRDIELLVGCDAIYLLPGWRYSKGATLEAAVAKGVGLVEIRDPDVDVWRSFEGDPIDHGNCEPAQGDGEGNAWCAHGEQVEEPDSPSADVISLARRLQAEGPDEFPEGYYISSAEQALRRHDAYRKGDSFPNVAYVRDMTGLPAAHLAAWARDQLDGRGDQ